MAHASFLKAMTTPISEERTEVGSYFIANYPPFSLWKPEHVPHARAALARKPDPATPLGLYLHIPFCRKRCKFCYFRVAIDKNSREVERYMDALAAEVEMLSRTAALAHRPIRFVYFGGGTPSFPSEKQLLSLVEKLRRVVSWDGAEEVTFECEPGTLTERKLHAIRDLGVTRLSLGVENFNDAILEENGRAHHAPEVFRAYGWARAAGFDQVNIDLIAGMVGETWENWRDCVRQAIDLSPDAVTVYQMELPWNAVYAKSIAGIQVADWRTKREWVDHAFRELEAAGYRVSSAYTLVKDPAETPHDPAPAAKFIYRDCLWRGADLASAGVASFSHVGGVHFQNVDGFDEYIALIEGGELPIHRALAPTRHQLLIRELILQLKLGRVDPAYFRAKFGADIRTEFAGAFRSLEEDGFLEPGGGDVRLTRDGLLRVDALLPLFFEPEHRGARYT
jgi:oxygen-independent coproporphyrinogen-3 oxidase